MTDAERIATATRAQRAWYEFFAPMIERMRAEYRDRMIDIASAELARDSRSDKLTALSHALKILANLENGMLATIRDGEVARNELLRAEKIEGMTAPRRRLLGIAPY